MTIHLLTPGHLRVGALIEKIGGPARALFGGSPSAGIEVAAIAVDGGDDAGIGGLAPPRSADWSPPSLRGLWVARSLRRRGLATELVEALADECQRRYGGPPAVRVSAPHVYRVMRRARARGAELLVDAHEAIPVMGQAGIRPVRDRVRAWALACGFNGQQAEDLSVVSSELVTNAVRHGAPLGSGIAIDAEIRIEGGHLVHTVTNVPRPPTPPPEVQPGGRGLSLAAEWTDHLTCTYTARTALPGGG